MLKTKTIIHFIKNHTIIKNDNILQATQILTVPAHDSRKPATSRRHLKTTIIPHVLIRQTGAAKRFVSHHSCNSAISQRFHTTLIPNIFRTSGTT